MNPTNIPWADMVWNPVHGCKFKCPYCYAEKLAHGRLHNRAGYNDPDPFKPRFFPEKLNEPASHRKPCRIFAVSMGDLFGEWVPPSWINKVLEVAYGLTQHRFLFLTKNPKRMVKLNLPPHIWLGTTITDMNMLTPQVVDFFTNCPTRNKFVSFEPLLDSVDTLGDPLRWAFWAHCQWFIIGCRTNPVVQPKKDWVDQILKVADYYRIPVFFKKPLKHPQFRQEYPKGLIL